MFEIGWGEMVVVAIVALVVLGPERLPKAARFAGLWVRKARAQWYSVKSEFEREMAADELRRSLAAQGADLRRDLEEAGRDVGASIRAAEAQLRLDTPAAPAVAPAPETLGADGSATAPAPAAATDAAEPSPQASLFAESPAPDEPRP